MKIFVTGATGYIGQAVTSRLQIAGHEVTGLTRTDSGARGLAARGITPVLGSLNESAVVADAARAVDAVVDTASADHTPSTLALLNALAGTGKRYLRTSGTGVYTDLAHGALNGTVYTEDSPLTPQPVVVERYTTDGAVTQAAARDIHTIVLRPSMIYGDGASEQLPLLVRESLRSGTSRYVGEGRNRWGNVYLADLAEAYTLALDKAPAGSTYNLAGGEAALRDIAGAIARLLGLNSARSCSPQEAYSVFGQRWVDVALSSNSRVCSSRALDELGWTPRGPELLDDLEFGSYKRLWSHKGDPHA